MTQFITNNMPHTWARACVANRRWEGLVADLQLDPVATRIDRAWRSRGFWMQNNIDIIHDLQAPFFGDNMEDLAMSDDLRENEENERQDDAVIE